MSKFVAILIFAQLMLLQGYCAFGEDYSECRQRCAADYTDCSNETPDPEPEVQAAKMAACDKGVQSCYADCENLRPIESPTGTEDNPNIIRK